MSNPELLRQMEEEAYRAVASGVDLCSIIAMTRVLLEGGGEDVLADKNGILYVSDAWQVWQQVSSAPRWR